MERMEKGHSWAGCFTLSFIQWEKGGWLQGPPKLLPWRCLLGFSFWPSSGTTFTQGGMTRATNFYWVLATGHVVHCYICFISLKFPTTISSWYYWHFIAMKLRLKDVKTMMDVTQLENPRAWIQSRVTWFQSPHITSNEDTKAGFAISFCL